MRAGVSGEHAMPTHMTVHVVLWTSLFLIGTNRIEIESDKHRTH